MRANMRWMLLGLERRMWIVALSLAMVVCFSPVVYAQCAGNAASTPITSTDETGSVPGARQLVSGLGTSVNLTTPGQVSVDLLSSSVATYMACTPAYTTPTTPTDFIVFRGSASKTVKILKIRLFMGETTAGNEKYRLIKRSTANSGGTFNTVTPVPVDSNDSAGSATLGYYTVNPTSLGTSVGSVIDAFLQTPIGTTGSSLQPPWFDLYDAPSQGKPLTLRGTNESVCLNNTDALTHTGQMVRLEVIWTEEI